MIGESISATENLLSEAGFRRGKNTAVEKIHKIPNPARKKVANVTK